MPTNCTGAFLWSFGVALVVSGGLIAGARLYLDRRYPGSRYDLTGLIAVLAVSVAMYLGSQDPLALQALPRFEWAILCALLVLAVGVVFDERPAPWEWRAVALAAIGLVEAALAIRIGSIKVPFAAHSAELGAAGVILTALWLALLSGLFGRSGTIRGIPAGVGLFAGLTFCLAHAIRPDLAGGEGGLLGSMIAGACLPLVLVAPHLQRGGATAGGYAIGFLVALASIAGSLKNTAFLVAAVPLLVVGAPLFAAIYTYAADLRSGWRAVAVASRREHLHELLTEQGYAPGQVLVVLLAGTAYLCALALLLVYMVEVSFILKLLLILVALAGGLVFLYVVLRMLPRPTPWAAETRPHEVRILGVKLHAVTMPRALEEAERFIREDRPRMVFTADASGLMRAHDDPEFRQIVNNADLVTPDGAGVVLSARLLNIPLEARCAGCDMVAGLSGVAAKLGRSVFLFGAAPGVAQKAAEKLQEQIPGLQIAGCQDGYFTPEDEPAIVARIKQARPAVLFVALGIPRQEKWIRAHLQELGVPICVGVGGSFDVISGLKKRAPVWMQRTGTEWLYRVAKEPYRLPRLAALPMIVLLSFRELLRPPQAIDTEPAQTSQGENP